MDLSRTRIPGQTGFFSSESDSELALELALEAIDHRPEMGGRYLFHDDHFAVVNRGEHRGTLDARQLPGEGGAEGGGGGEGGRGRVNVLGC